MAKYVIETGYGRCFLDLTEEELEFLLNKLKNAGLYYTCFEMKTKDKFWSIYYKG